MHHGSVDEIQSMEEAMFCKLFARDETLMSQTTEIANLRKRLHSCRCGSALPFSPLHRLLLVSFVDVTS